MSNIRKLRVALFISGNGSTAEAIIKACKNGSLHNIIPACVISSKANALGIQKAKQLGISTYIVTPKTNQSRFGTLLLKILSQNKIDLISQNGWLPKTPIEIIHAYKGRIINQHPGPLDPGRHHDFGGKGMYGLRVTAAVLVYMWATHANKPFTESIIHHVTPEFDTGEIIRRVRMPIQCSDRNYLTKSLWNNPRELLYITDSVQKKLLPIEHANVIAVLQSFALNHVPHYMRIRPLIPAKYIHILSAAKQYAISLYPNQSR